MIKNQRSQGYKALSFPNQIFKPNEKSHCVNNCDILDSLTEVALAELYGRSKIARFDTAKRVMQILVMLHALLHLHIV